MKLFKNKVGRPSNKTLRKRKIFLSLVIVFILLFGFGVFFILNNRNVISQNKGIVVNSKPVLKITQITKGSSVKKVQQ